MFSQGMGFEIARGPDIEDDYHNFEALNIPERSSGARHAGHVFRRQRPFAPHSYFAGADPHHGKPQAAAASHRPGRRLSPAMMTPRIRRCSIRWKASWSTMHITFSDLKGVLTHFLRQIFSHETGVRFRPSFFPFTEPSAEIDIQMFRLRRQRNDIRRSACRVCKGTGWLEILGAGMIDPEVFRFVGYDPEKVSGFAFGMGVERIAMLKYGIDDIRLFFHNDLRFLRQFG